MQTWKQRKIDGARDKYEFLVLYLAHVIEQPKFRIRNPPYFVYLLDQTVGRDTLQFIY